MQLKEFTNLEKVIKPGDIVAIKYRAKVDYVNSRTGNTQTKSEEKQEILEFERAENLYIFFKGDFKVYHVNLTYIKKINARAATTNSGNFQTV